MMLLDSLSEFCESMFSCFIESKIFAALLIFVVIYILVTIVSSVFSKKRKKKTRHSQNYHTSTTKRTVALASSDTPITRGEILQSLSNEARLDYSHLYQKLDEVQSLVESYGRNLDWQRIDAQDSIKNKIQESQIQIDNHWRYNKAKRAYYQCIANHYASFTLADTIKSDHDALCIVYKDVGRECKKLAGIINELNIKISNSHGAERQKLMLLHKQTCKQHQRACRCRSLLGTRKDEFLAKLHAQNRKTEEYREYIIKNFGAKGKAWGERLKQRKLARQK